jgi:two-component system, OmpR family, phosphate regulon sensor histidine kinase PhoR
MNRKRFTWLITMMVISLAGITGVQIYWVRNAIAIGNENFNNSVQNALQQTVGSIESSRRVAFFNDFMLKERPWDDTISGISGVFSFGSFESRFGGGFSLNITGNAGYSVPRQGPLTSHGEKQEEELMIDAMIPEGDSVTIVITAPGESVSDSPFNPAPEGFTKEKRIVISQDEYLDWLKRRATEFQRMSEQMVSEMYDWESQSEIDDRLVKSTLNRTLAHNGIRTPYEFAIVRGNKIAGGDFTSGNSTEILSEGYMVRLFPGRLVKEEVVLSVIFPQKRDFVLGNMTWLLFSSLIFSMIVLATFALSLFFIIRQKKISEMRADFINNMTHEFKTPIATISLAADTITNPRVISDEAGVRHFVGMIKKENSRMNRQVETILQIASLDKQDIDFRFGDVPVHSIIERAAEAMEIQIQQKNGTLSLKLDAIDSVIYGDAEHLTNLVHNLLDNANKYSLGEPEITVSTINRDNGIVLSVSDKGIGMSKTVQTRIFERFYRQPAGNIHNVKGFGLGLSYVKSIVEAHKGVIEVTSEPSKGTRFDIYLPFNWGE